MKSRQGSEQMFFGVSALLFVASAAATILWCAHMSALGEMPMAGGTMPTVWMPGPRAALSFLGMWIVMMAAMMLPSLVPMLLHYRRAVDRSGGMPLDLLTSLVAAAYFIVWALAGAAVYPLGILFDALQMRQPLAAEAAPFAIGASVLTAGVLQFTVWKSRRLACCRTAPRPLPADAGTALRHGLRLGQDCISCCANLTAALLAIGIMDLRAMTVVAAAITAERLGGERAARAVGIVLVAAGIIMLALAVKI